MQVAEFNKDYYENMCDWLRARELYLPPVEEMPKIGLVITNNGVAVAMAFLRNIEGNMALFDGLVTNPSAPADVRDEANDLLTTALIEKAKVLKFKLLIALSHDKNTLLRSYRHGFTHMPHAFIVKSLSNEVK